MSEIMKYSRTQEYYGVSIPLPASAADVRKATDKIQEDWKNTYGSDVFTPDTLQVTSNGSSLYFEFKGSASLSGRS